MLVSPCLPACTASLLCHVIHMGTPNSSHDPGVMHRRVVVFWHVYVTGTWEAAVRDQATKLIFSGLYRQAAAINVGVGARNQSVTSGCASHFAVHACP